MLSPGNIPIGLSVKLNKELDNTWKKSLQNGSAYTVISSKLNRTKESAEFIKYLTSVIQSSRISVP